MFALELFGAILAMALKDSLSVGLVVAESKNRAFVAGVLDAGLDIAQIMVTLVGAGTIIVHGWTPHSFVILAVICLTSFFGTIVWTKLSHRLMPGSSA